MTERKRTEVLERALYRVAEAAGQATDFASFFAEMHKLVDGLMPARNFSIALCDEAEPILTFPYYSDELGETPPARAEKSLTGFVFRSGEPLLASPRVLLDLQRNGEVDLVGPAPVSWLGVPLKTTGKPFGVLAVQTYEEDVRYGERERELLLYVSAHIAAAIERKRADQRLRESEERFRLLVEGVKDYAIFGLDTEGRVATWNSGAEWINGYKAAEILGRHFSCFYPAEDIEAGKPGLALAAAARAGQAEEEGWRVRKDGTRYYASVLITALRDDQGRLKGFSEVTRDISERRRIEEALHESERRLRTIFEAEPECVTVLTGEGTLLDMNPAGLAICEADDLESVLGKSVLPILAEEHREAFAELIRSAARGQPGTSTLEIVGLKGTRRWLVPDGTALDLLPRLKAIDPATPIVVLTAHGSIDLAVRAIKEGAEHFLAKPLELPTLQVVLERIAENRRSRQERLARRSRRTRRARDPFLGTSAAIKSLARDCERLLHSDLPILLQGETGSGKGVLARWFHENGPRSEETFVDLNCAGLSRDLLETELFGHEKGAFTGAAASKPGLLEIAHRGTLFLDEIADMDLQVQPKLLKALEEMRFRRLGDVSDRHVDVRLVAASHQDLGELVREKRFREDLYFRINTLQLLVPPLRARVEDVPMLARYFLAGIGRELGRPKLELAEDAIDALCGYSWPGNVRELKNVLERAVLLSEAKVLTRADLRLAAPERASLVFVGTHLSLAEVECLHIQRVLREECGHVERAARRLGISRSSLYSKIKQAGIVAPRADPESC